MSVVEVQQRPSILPVTRTAHEAPISCQLILPWCSVGRGSVCATEQLQNEMQAQVESGVTKFSSVLESL